MVDKTVCARSKLRNLVVLALCTLLLLQLGRLLFIWKFGSLQMLATPAGRDSLYLGLKFDLRLVAIIFAAPWTLLQTGVVMPRRRVLGAWLLALSLLIYLGLVVVGMADDRAGRGWLVAFLLAAGVSHLVCGDYGLDSGREARALWAAYGTAVTLFVLACYATDFGSYAYNHARLNGTILQFLDNPLISARMVWQSYPVGYGVLLSGLALSALFLGAQTLGGWHGLSLSRPARWSVNTLVSIALVAFMWGKQSLYPLRWSEAFDGRSHFVAQAALNPVLFLLETRMLPDAKVDIEAVKSTHQALAAYFGISAAFDAKGEPTLLRTIAPRPLVSGTPNIVLIQLESLSASKTSMGGNMLDPTPFLKQLADRSIYFDNFYVAMQNTSRSMFATLFGIADVSDPSGNATRNPLLVDQHSLLNYLHGYDKYYFLGGSANWAQIRAAIKNNITDVTIVEEGDYAAPVVDVWGVADADLLLEGGARLNERARRPYLGFFQTSGNHEPYTIPNHLKDFERTELPAAKLAAAGFESNAEFEAVRLMDYSLRKFFEAQENSPEFMNTVYVLWADHGMPRGNTDLRFAPLLLVNHHIPAMIYAPGFIGHGRHVASSGSQMDILPTLLSLLGRETQTQTLGKDLLDPRYETSSGAFLFSTWERPPTLGFVRNGDLMLHRPGGRDALYDLAAPTETDRSAQSPALAAELSQLAVGFEAWSSYLMKRNPPLVKR